MYFTQLSMELARLLAVRFVPGQEGGPVGISLGRVFVSHNRGQHEFRDRELTRLTLLAEDLRQIETFNPDLLRHFQKKYSEGTSAQYLGIRMEIATAAILIRRHIPFDKGESPDFRLPVDGGRIAIECGSTHLAGGKTSVGEKIAGAIRSKVSLTYFDTDTALFLDITNILHHSLLSRDYLEQEHIEQIARNEMSGRRVGATVLFWYFLDKPADRFELNAARVDNDTAGALLTTFLDQHFSTEGGGLVADYDIPSEG